ncbi:response regulator [Synechocystis sp. LKSZ1]|uniref:response regulator n=1 Tax=Synechocystis sp. LKSZ1 TaxID=3144951 RepID=UPI00336C2742
MMTTSLPKTYLPVQLLQTLEANQATGKLTIQNPFDEFVTWQVYLGDGKIHFANSGVGIRERMQYLLGYHLQQQQDLPEQVSHDYSHLYHLWRRGIFSLQQTRSILTRFTQEALVQILALPQSTCFFNDQETLEDPFLKFELDKVMAPLKHKVKFWQALHTEISSPFQRPLVEDWGKIKASLSQHCQRDNQWLAQFNRGLTDLSCLYNLASRTHTNVLELALLLRPQVQQGGIKMLPYQDIQVDRRPLIVSINHRPALQRMVQATLDHNGFKTLCLQESLTALAVVMSQKPSAVLVEADMPGLNGYELCRLIRQSLPVKETPVILLTPQASLVDRIQGKLAQASAYLEKPFLPQELLTVVEAQLMTFPLAS